MKPSRARIERFLETMEASLAPPIDRTKWIRLLSLEPGETREAAVRRHLQEHPEDREQAEWMAWLWSGVPRQREEPLPDGVGQPPRPASLENDICRSEKPPAPPATGQRLPVEKPTASRAPRPVADELKPKPLRAEYDPFTDEMPEPVDGFGRRLRYGPAPGW
jgi:hypothetical protein